MKRYIQYIYITFLLIGCSKDFIEKNPLDGAAPGDFLDSKEAYRSALDGVYAVMKEELTAYNMSFLTVTESVSDNLLGTNEGFAFDGVDRDIYPLAYGSDAFQLEGLWRISYQAIENANTIIREARGASNPDFAAYLGEALALRAYLHYNLYRLFAPAYVSDQEAPAVPYRFETDALLDIKPRNTNKELIEYVLNDLEEAERLATNEANSYRISLTAVRALMGRIYHETGNYEQAVKYTEQALTDTKYKLVNTVEALEDEWYYDESNEIIFRIRFDDSEGNVNAAMFAIPIYFSYPFNAPQELLDLYDKDNDIRFPVYFGENPLQPGAYFPKKYVGLRTVDEASFNPGTADLKLIRVPELYLILAESYAKLSENTKAITALNTLRANRGIGAYESGSEPLLDAILKERRKELVFEGFRFTDLKRLEQGFTRTDGSSMSPNDTRYALPIPQLEIDRSGIEQNQGY